MDAGDVAEDACSVRRNMLQQTVEDRAAAVPCDTVFFQSSDVLVEAAAGAALLQLAIAADTAGAAGQWPAQVPVDDGHNEPRAVQSLQERRSSEEVLERDEPMAG